MHEDCTMPGSDFASHDPDFTPEQEAQAREQGHGGEVLLTVA